MAAIKRSQANAFAGIKTEGAAEAGHRHTSGMDTQMAPADPTPTVETTDTPRRGRPPGNEVRAPFTCRPLAETVKQLRVYAAENGCTVSRIIDVLTDMHLHDADVAEALIRD